MSGRVRGVPAAELRLRLVEETRWLHDVPVLEATALTAAQLRATGAGQARIEVSTEGAEPDTLTLRVTPRRPIVERLVLPAEGSDAPLLLRGFDMERIAPGAVSAGQRPVTVVARDSANLYFRISELPNAACGSGAPLPITVAGAEAPPLSYERAVIAPVMLRVGEALSLNAEQMACLQLPGGIGARYALAALDTRPCAPAARRWAARRPCWCATGRVPPPVRACRPRARAPSAPR